jgi:hypothetical protein
VLTAAFPGVIGGQGAVPVLTALLVRLRHARRERTCRAAAPRPGLLRWPVGEQEVIVTETLGRDMGADLDGDLLAELESPVLLVLGVVLDEEPAAVRVLIRGELNHRAADGQHAGSEI